MLDARFTMAARRLKVLAEAAPRSQRGMASNWARIFDETVPDEMEIAEAEAV
jgi:type IV secretion system protein VirD4